MPCLHPTVGSTTAVHGFKKGLLRKTLRQLPNARDPPFAALCVDLRPGCEQRLNLPVVTALQTEDGNTRTVVTIREDKAVREVNTRKDVGPTQDTGLRLVKMERIPPHHFQACTTRRTCKNQDSRFKSITDAGIMRGATNTQHPVQPRTTLELRRIAK